VNDPSDAHTGTLLIDSVVDNFCVADADELARAE